MSNNIAAKTEYACCGCGACAAICPEHAITLQLDDAGFFGACVDEAKCVACGMCVTVCTRFDERVDGINLRDAELYAVQSANCTTVKESSSGGLAHELALQAIADNYEIVGVSYNTKTDKAEHVIVSCTEQMQRLDGSKYMQSDTGVLRTVISKAKLGTRFAVFGTPCQIAGLAKAAEDLGIRDRFLLVEIFCHGVPSYKLWEIQCDKVRKKLKCGEFDSVQFRYKKNDWHSYCLKVNANGKTYYGERETELFWQVFFENILLGDACQNCRARKEISKADIRLGDYWGSRFQHRSDGVSAAFVCTERGRNAITRLCEKGAVHVFEPGDAGEMLAAQNMSGYSNIELHNEAMNKLRETGRIVEAVELYRAKMPLKQKLRRMVLRASAILPGDMRAKLRKANSSRKLRK